MEHQCSFPQENFEQCSAWDAELFQTIRCWWVTHASGFDNELFSCPLALSKQSDWLNRLQVLLVLWHSCEEGSHCWGIAAWEDGWLESCCNAINKAPDGAISTAQVPYWEAAYSQAHISFSCTLLHTLTACKQQRWIRMNSCQNEINSTCKAPLSPCNETGACSGLINSVFLPVVPAHPTESNLNQDTRF